MLRALLANGADPNVADNDGTTALTIAALGVRQITWLCCGLTAKDLINPEETRAKSVGGDFQPTMITAARRVAPAGGPAMSRYCTLRREV